MEYKNESGQSLSDIIKEAEEKDKGIQIVIVGEGASEGKMAHIYSKMMQSDKFYCVDINTLPQKDRDALNKAKEEEKKTLPDPGSMESMVSELLDNIKKDAEKLRLNQAEVFISDKTKPWNERLPRHKKKKYWQ